MPAFWRKFCLICAVILAELGTQSRPTGPTGRYVNSFGVAGNWVQKDFTWQINLHKLFACLAVIYNMLAHPLPALLAESLQLDHGRHLHGTGHSSRKFNISSCTILTFWFCSVRRLTFNWISVDFVLTLLSSCCCCCF